tara:strand:+ start:2255 stop:3868 length:1614 start_codon:yes stop_codon:yes gene_type:complete
MKKLLLPTKSILLLFTFIVLFGGCSSTVALLNPPIKNTDFKAPKSVDLTKDERLTWSHLDLVQDSVPGVSLNRAYDELVKTESKTIVVAVIDSGIDITHEDLEGNIWVNKDEIPNNGVDDDKNGYVDDINGWNFLGDSTNEQLEYVRLIASNDTSDPRFEEAKKLLESELNKYTASKNQYENISVSLKAANNEVLNFLKVDSYSKEDILSIKTKEEKISQSLEVLKQAFNFGVDSIPELIDELDDYIKSLADRLNYYLNVEFDGRSVVGDDPNDLNDRNYGDNNVMPKKGSSHGTHVSGIIAAVRNNGLGVNGAANNVKIMAIRNTPNGDEYDKDVALGVYYAVNNGANIINMSFGKSFSPHSDWVRDALAYAAKKNVLIVAAAGNDADNTDLVQYYPNDQLGTGNEVSDTFIKVGSSTYSFNSKLPSSFSNYGQSSVDVFAPGSAIYSTYPKNEYEYAQGTSMASPLVAGVAALVWSQYPKLSAAEVKQIIMSSGLSLSLDVDVGDKKNIPFTEVSKSGKLINAYNALIMASNVSK